ncbi:PstS family phosphate ABC transporter substrate-binding protein [Alloalcanivorax venustensis]|jgi:phosphate transport system substrate-binding protein|uniref:PstS family phosphate ABC transporter substrate-binding protein n=2 Tax=Gammaproteobacteria TaxID=1236 RepID=UPI000C5D2355|nr:hypothetical protein [Alcanivorax sp.]NQY83880.1 substrate-binding domain-containing protein [Alcanivorax sp.]HIK73260.1 hypothetical protein [Alcanivorax sp.]|tara:strand:+ start:413 stop:1708 length:1296 start_codon:yes stop_codon:yes gene_type:complete
MNTIIKKATLAAAIISAPLAASAFTNLVGGGASLPALAYVGDNFTTTDPRSRLSTDDYLTSLLAGNDSVGNPYEQAVLAQGSIFDVFQNYHPGDYASYCQTGSGTGKRVLVGANSLNADGDCRDYNASPVGFSAPAGQTDPDFVSSGAPLTADEVIAFLNGPRANRQDLVQVPALSTLIALPLNLGNDVFGNPINRPNLSTAQVCDIFSGDSTSWDEIDPTWPREPINVFYRSDRSGATFAFIQYLAAVCNDSQVIFITHEDFATAAPVGDYAIATPTDGEFNITDQLSTSSWSIGYAGIGSVLAEQGLDYADVEGEDPADTTQIAYGSNDLLTGQVLGDINPFTGLPQPEPVSGIDSNCLLVINPTAQLTGAYPIHAVINLLTYTDGHTDPQALEELIETVVDGSSILPTGFARLTVGATASATAASCIN